MKKMVFELKGAEALSKEEMSAIEGGCSVTCSSGYNACCNAGECKCFVAGGREPEGGCASGGGGASSCTY